MIPTAPIPLFQLEAWLAQMPAPPTPPRGVAVIDVQDLTEEGLAFCAEEFGQ